MQVAHDGFDGIEPEIIGLQAIQFIQDIRPTPAFFQQIGDGGELAQALLGFFVVALDTVVHIFHPLALFLHGRQSLGIELGPVQHAEPSDEKNHQDAGQGRENKRLLPFQSLLATNHFRYEGYLDGTRQSIAQPQPDDLAEHVGDFLELLAVHLRPQSHHLERIEISDFHVQLFGEKVVRIGHGRTTAGEIEMRRPIAVLLRTIHADGAIDFAVQAGHHITNDFRHGGGDFAFRFGVGPSERHEPMPPFQFLRFGKTDAEFLADLLGNRVTGNGNGTSEKAVAVGKKQVGAAPADIQDDGAFFLPDAVGPGGVVGRRRSHIDQKRFQPHRLHRPGHLFGNLVFDDDEHHVHFSFFGIGDQLIVPDDLVHIEGDVLFCLELDDLPDAFLVFGKRGKFDKSGEGRLAGQANQGSAGVEIIFHEHLSQEAGDDSRTRALGQLLFVFPMSEVDERPCISAGVFEFPDLDAGRANINCQNAV